MEFSRIYDDDMQGRIISLARVLQAGALLALSLAGAHPVSAADTQAVEPVPGVESLSRTSPSPVDTLKGADYFAVDLQPLRTAPNRAHGRAAVWFSDSPFTVAVTPEGFYTWEFALRVQNLPRRPNATYVAWLAAPDLDPLHKLGIVEEDQELTGRVDFDNQFILFVTAEEDADVERPKGMIMLRGISRSGYLDSMFAHGFCPWNEVC